MMTMIQKVAQANIEHYQLLLKSEIDSEIDDIKRATVTKLLAEEHDKLDRILAAKRLAILSRVSLP
jgi:hypothetical protein